MIAQDTLVVAKPVKHKFSPETLKATMMAVSFPDLVRYITGKYGRYR